MELVDPVARVLDEERARGRRRFEVDGLAPVVRVAPREVVAREVRQVIPVGPDVVVDHVEDDPEAERVRAIDERPQIVRRAIEPRRRIQVDAVVAPAEAAGKVGDGHHLDDRDAEIGERLQLGGRRAPGAFGGEGADVQLVDHLPICRDAGPVVIGPSECRGVDDRRRSVRTIRLIAGHRIGTEQRAVQPQPIAVASPGVRQVAGKVTVALTDQRPAPAAIGVADDVDRRAVRGPDTRVGSPVHLNLHACREAPLP